MSEPGLEVLDTTLQKTHEWINETARVAHVDHPTAYKALRAVLHALRDRLPIQEAVHFSAQLPMLMRGLFFDGWRPANTPIKFSQQQFLSIISESIVGVKGVDPLRITRSVFAVINHHISSGEVEKVRNVLPKDLQALWPEPLAIEMT